MGRRGSKRPKIAVGASGGDARDDARNDALESEIHALRQQLVRSEAEVARVRRENERLRQQLQGNHEVLPVSKPTVVDLSRVDTSLVTQIASFVGTSRELLNLALTCKSFGWQQPAAGLDLSLAEEVARKVVVSSGQNNIEGVRITLPQYVRGGTTWLSILHESEYPMKFDTLRGGIEHQNRRRTSVRAINSGDSTAIASNYIMDSGIHYAEFQITAGYPYIGIARSFPNLDPARFVMDSGGFHFFVKPWYDQFLTARTDEWGHGNVFTHECEYGYRSWTNWEGGGEEFDQWEGMETCNVGDTLGLLLDLGEGKLTVYKNKRRLGVMIDGLSGSYCWYVTLTRTAAVEITRGEAPRS